MTTFVLLVADALGRRRMEFPAGTVAVGRGQVNDVRVQGSEVSRQHCELFADPSGYWIRDLGSRYGTYVNGEQVAEARIADGDQIRLGRTGGAEIQFEVEREEPVSAANLRVFIS